MTPTDYILTPTPLTEEALEALTAEADRHPYYHAAAITLTHALYQNHSPLYGDTLRRTAASVPDRAPLFALIEGKDYQLQTVPSSMHPAATQQPNHPAPLREPISPAPTTQEPTTQPQQSRTTSLIDRYLDTLPAPAQRRSASADASTDYIAFLMQSDAPADDTASLYDIFLPPSPQQPPTAPDSRQSGTPLPAEQPTAEQPADDNADLSPEYFTETMARIYIKQGKFDKASKIITRLNAKYPKKNRYFADQMRFLEKLMLNQSYSKH